MKNSLNKSKFLSAAVVYFAHCGKIYIREQVPVMPPEYGKILAWASLERDERVLPAHSKNPDLAVFVDPAYRGMGLAGLAIDTLLAAVAKESDRPRRIWFDFEFRDLYEPRVVRHGFQLLYCLPPI